MPFIRWAKPHIRSRSSSPRQKPKIQFYSHFIRFASFLWSFNSLHALILGIYFHHFTILTSQSREHPFYLARAMWNRCLPAHCLWWTYGSSSRQHYIQCFAWIFNGNAHRIKLFTPAVDADIMIDGQTHLHANNETVCTNMIKWDGLYTFIRTIATAMDLAVAFRSLRSFRRRFCVHW